jgi:glucuronate isomerase
MSKKFLDDGFLLQNEVGLSLYEKHASVMPIVDFHNHLPPKEIAQNRKFNNITEAWLEGDHYKWRAMRYNGIAEEFCTGNAAPFDKFFAWAQTVPFTMRNPLYHWTHLELKNYFGVDKLLNKETAKEVYEHCSSLLQQEDFSVQSLLKKMDVEVVCTTDDPADSLEYHQQFGGQQGSLKMYPSFRPDKSYTVNDARQYNDYIDRLGHTANTTIYSFDDLIDALRKRMNFFMQLGCRGSDHGVEALYFDKDYLTKAPAVFRKAREGNALSNEEKQLLQCGVLIHLSKIYHELGWVQQFHIGAQRSVNSRMLKRVGPDSGFESIGEYLQAKSMADFFDHLDSSDELTKTIIYNSNPAHNEVFATMIGNFSDGSSIGKMQFGAGWWFLDQKDGMEKQINALSNMGLLSRFVGMVTDSRSFLSFSRHEYFRRVLCNLIGQDVEQGELPDDRPWLGEIIRAICYSNAKDFFRL